MKEMIYEKDRKMEILQDNKYRGYRYIILSMGTHPTAYIEIPKGHILDGKDGDELDINVHGGITYSRHEMYGIKTDNWYIGWDYAHLGDYLGYEEELYPRANHKKWSTAEIERDCKKAIEEIIDKYEIQEDKDIPLIPDDEFAWIRNNRAINYNFKVLKEKVNQLIEEFNEYRKENK